MDDRERRRADRVAFDLPAEVRLGDGVAQARTQDVSRSGARLRVPCDALGITPSLNLATTAAAVRDLFGDTVELKIRHKVFSRGAERVGSIARIELPLDAPDAVELGLHFDESIEDRDALDLGIVLPAVRAFVEPSEPTAPELTGAPASLGAATSCTYRAFLSSAAAGALPSLACHSDLLSREVVRVRVPRAGFDAESTAEATVSFADRYGTRLTMKLVDVHKHLWTGPVRLCALDLPRERPDDMLLTFAFERRLRPAELRRLGLDRGAA